MHIEPGLVDGAKIVLSYATATAAFGYAAKLSWDEMRKHGFGSLVARAVAASVLVFCFFEVLPHYPVGVSEVHFILGTTLLLLFGVAPAAIGLSIGLLAQGLLFAPADLAQYGMNITTILVPLFAIKVLADRIIPPQTPYVDVKYSQALALSTAYQGGVVAWVAFWALYGAGFGAENVSSIASFGLAYMLVIVVEPLADLAVLAIAKSLHGMRGSWFFTQRLHHASA